MNASNQQQVNEKLLWRQFAAQDQKPPALSDLEPNILAAYIDGKASTTQVEQIEALMAADPSLLDEVIELRRLQDTGATFVRREFVDRAKALVASQPVPAATSRTGLWHRFQWAAAAAVFALACLGGYSLGRLNLSGQGLGEALVAADTSRDVETMITEPTLAIILLPNGQNGGAQ